MAQTPTPQPKTTCKEVIKACDEALEAKNKALELSDLAVKQCQEHNGSLQKEVNDLRDSQGSFFRNPVVWFLLGSVATTGAYLLLKK